MTKEPTEAQVWHARYMLAQAENEHLRCALEDIAKYEIDEGCTCSACRHSAIARAALEGKS